LRETDKLIEKSNINWKIILISYILFGVLSVCLIALYPSPALSILIADIGSILALLLILLFFNSKGVLYIL